MAVIVAGADLKELERHVLSLEYRKTAFEVALIGSDEVVMAYNDLMQQFYRGQPGAPSSPYGTLRFYGVLLLAIRKSLGNATTKLDEWDMLRHMVTDLDAALEKLGIETAETRRRRRLSNRGEPSQSMT